MHVIDWHSDFDALIGTEDFRQLGAKIYYVTNTLEISGISIPFFFEYSSRQIAQTKVAPGKFLKIPVSIENGEVVFPETHVTSTLFIPESIMIAQNGYCNVPVEQAASAEINLSERIQVTPLVHEEITEPPKLINNSLNLANVIRIEHLNVIEEREKLIELCSKFKDVFYDENCDLSFTNAVKHEIRTKDDTPVHVKSYRHPFT